MTIRYISYTVNAENVALGLQARGYKANPTQVTSKSPAPVSSSSQDNPPEAGAQARS
jgi:hypothetical protein